jgi:transmembrane sensor
MVDKNEEAARWFAASRRGVMLHDERADYERWRGEPENAARLAELQVIWQGLEPGPAVADIAEPAIVHSGVSHRRQVAAMVAFVSLTATVLIRIDGGWWNTLDWWSR